MNIYGFKKNILGVGPEKTLNTDGHVTPLGKQTVAEAAKSCGSSLHLYRNPFESSKDEENDCDEELSGEEDLKNDTRMISDFGSS